MKLLFLGSGTSYGVPMIGCDCPVCRSDDPRDKRTRPSVLVRVNGKAILIDTSSDLRAQALRCELDSLDAILFTHAHADHLHGIDDVRSFSALRRMASPAYGDEHTVRHIKKSYEYIFKNPEFHFGWGIPRLDLRVITGPERICDITVKPVLIQHGERTILGYRIGNMAYLTDCSAVPKESMPLLQGLDTLVLGALRHKPHPTHFSLSEALDFVESVSPRRAYFTHISHDLGHAKEEKALPEHIRLSYDGLEVEIPNDPGT